MIAHLAKNSVFYNLTRPSQLYAQTIHIYRFLAPLRMRLIWYIDTWSFYEVRLNIYQYLNQPPLEGLIIWIWELNFEHWFDIWLFKHGFFSWKHVYESWVSDDFYQLVVICRSIKVYDIKENFKFIPCTRSNNIRRHLYSFFLHHTLFFFVLYVYI